MAENKQKVVLDASVLLKFVIDEKEDREQAHDLKRRIGLNEIEPYIPSFCFYEISNILSKSTAFDSIKEVHIAYTTLRLYNCTEVPLDDFLVHDTFYLMKNTPKISFYDAIYHAIAILKKATFITADKKYYNLMKSHGHIKLLSEWR